MLAVLDAHHGTPVGMHAADEHYAGREPSQGFETCAVVETLYSLGHLLAAFGLPEDADRLERIAYNALPAALTEDHWAHQYDQQPNQVLCSLSSRSWVTNGPESNLFGLAPNFGCCTANLHQGWPKLVARSWMSTADGGGLAAVVLGPSEVKTTLRGVAVSVSEDTEYPFRGRVRFVVRPSRPLEFPLHIRVPAWADGARASVNGEAREVPPGAFLVIERRWRRGDVVTLELPMQPRIDPWPTGGVIVTRGPLVMALRVEEHWRPLRRRGRAADWEVYPLSPWNMALSLHPAPSATDLRLEVRPLAAQPFNPRSPPILLHTWGRRLPSWQLVHESAGPVPSEVAPPLTPEEPIALVPYGAARLRVTVLPLAKRAAPRCPPPREEPVTERDGRSVHQVDAAPVELWFENNCTGGDGREVALYWVRYDGTERSYGSVPEGTARPQSTFVGHLWRVRAAASGRLLREVRAVSEHPLIIPACGCGADRE